MAVQVTRRPVRDSRPFFFCIFLLCCASFALILTAYLTDYWFTADCYDYILQEDSTGEVNLGLFTGESILQSIVVVTYDYRIVCLDGDCIYSKYETESEREDSIEELQSRIGGGPLLGDFAAGTAPLYSAFKNGFPELADSTNVTTSIPYDFSTSVEFLSESLWLSTIIFMAFGGFLAVVSAGFTILNIATKQFYFITGPLGIFIWDGASVVCLLVSVICWSVQYNEHMKSNVLVEETSWTTEGEENLGYSFWLVVLSLLIQATNLLILFFGIYEISFGDDDLIEPYTKDDEFLY